MLELGKLKQSGLFAFCADDTGMPVSCASQTYYFLANGSSTGSISSSLSSACVLHTLLLLRMEPILKTFHVLVNCCLICNWRNSKFIQIYDNSCISIIHNAQSNSRRLIDSLKSSKGVRQYHGSGG